MPKVEKASRSDRSRGPKPDPEHRRLVRSLFVKDYSANFSTRYCDNDELFGLPKTTFVNAMVSAFPRSNPLPLPGCKGKVKEGTADIVHFSHLRRRSTFEVAQKATMAIMCSSHDEARLAFLPALSGFQKVYESDESEEEESETDACSSDSDTDELPECEYDDYYDKFNADRQSRSDEKESKPPKMSAALANLWLGVSKKFTNFVLVAELKEKDPTAAAIATEFLRTNFKCLKYMMKGGACACRVQRDLGKVFVLAGDQNGVVVTDLGAPKPIPILAEGDLPCKSIINLTNELKRKFQLSLPLCTEAISSGGVNVSLKREIKSHYDRESVGMIRALKLSSFLEEGKSVSTIHVALNSLAEGPGKQGHRREQEGPMINLKDVMKEIFDLKD